MGGFAAKIESECLMNTKLEIYRCASLLGIDNRRPCFEGKKNLRKVKLFLRSFKHEHIKAHGGKNVYFHVFLTSALNSGKWSDSQLGSSAFAKSPRYPLDRGQSGPQRRPVSCLQDRRLSGPQSRPETGD
jgi:hypothetical protein